MLAKSLLPIFGGAILITFLLLTSNSVSGATGNDIRKFEEIIDLSYTHDIYLTYENGRPVFYINEPKEFRIKKTYVYANNDLIPLVKSLGFKVSNTSYNIIVTNSDISTDKKAIIFLKCGQSQEKEVIWLEDPLKLGKSKVYAFCNLSKQGTVIAKYTDGGIAVVKVDNKIYVGFKPSRTTLANLMMIQIVEDVKPEISIVQVVIVGVVTLLMLYSIIKEIIFKILSKLFDFLSVLVVGVGGFINLHDKDGVLLNDLRRKIYEYILENPGVHLREIQRRFNVSLSSVTWHLKMLEKAGLIKSAKFRNKLVYYPTGMNKEDLLLMLTLNNKIARSIVEYIAKVGETHLRKIAKDLDLNVETVRYHLKRLERGGVLISKEIDNKIVYTLNPEIFAK